jgi:hypothetical protein
MPSKDIIELLKKRLDDNHKESEAITAFLKLVEKEDDIVYDRDVDIFEKIIKYCNEQTHKGWKKKFENVLSIQKETAQPTVTLRVGDHKFYGGGRGIPILPPKSETITWKKYLLGVIEMLGGEGKTNDIANAIILSNKDITYTKARQTAADMLPELVDEGKLFVIKGESRKEGNTYSLKNPFEYNLLVHLATTK